MLVAYALLLRLGFHLNVLLRAKDAQFVVDLAEFDE